jgi:ParB-like chromosome segregation protein Spo0J
MPPVNISLLKPDEKNVRLHDERNIEAIKASLSRFGQQKPILVDANNVVLAGNGTLLAARELGWKKINITKTNLSGEEARAYAIADNRTTDLSVFSEADLVESLSQIMAGSEDIEMADMGFSVDEYNDMIESQEDPPPPKNFPEMGDDLPTEHQCPKCRYKWSGSSS